MSEPWIVRTPGVKGGRPVIRGTRLTVEAVQSRLRAGDSLHSIATDYDYIPLAGILAAAFYLEDDR